MTASNKHADELRALLNKLVGERQHYDFQPPTLVSHAKDYANDPPRLRRYAKQVISGRVMILLAFSRMNTQRLLQTYLSGLDSRNPFPMLLAARSQLELFAVVADTTTIIADNSGEQDERFVERVTTVDEALIKATFGTRSTDIKDQMRESRLSRLREASETDWQALTSKNVLTRLERLSKYDAYPECREHYERLCEYVHPNYGMNMLHVVRSPVHEKLLRFSLTSDEPCGRALLASAEIMIRAALGTLEAVERLQPPFGIGTPSFLS